MRLLILFIVCNLFCMTVYAQTSTETIEHYQILTGGAEVLDLKTGLASNHNWVHLGNGSTGWGGDASGLYTTCVR